MDDNQRDSNAQIVLVQGNNDIKSQAAKWLFGQESNTVALYLILAGLACTAYTGMPLYLKSQREAQLENTKEVREGYREVAAVHEKSRDEDRKIRSEENEKTRDMIRDLATRHEKSEERNVRVFEETVNRLQHAYSIPKQKKLDQDE